MKAQIEQLVRYTIWANDRVYAQLESANALSDRVTAGAAHLARAEDVWSLRLLQESPGDEPIWPDWSLAVANQKRKVAEQRILHYVTDSSDATLTTLLSYSNSKGERFETQIYEILMQLTLHGAYHRGQLMESLRCEGSPTVNTDFITFVRTP